MFSTLQLNPSGLQILDVAANHITNDAVNMIRDYLASNPALLALDLSFNRIRPGGIPPIVAGLKSNTHLRRLDLSGNQLETAGAVALAELFKPTGACFRTLDQLPFALTMLGAL